MPMEDERVQILLKFLTARRYGANLLEGTSTRKTLQKRPSQLSRGATGIKNTFIAVQLKLAQNAVSPPQLWRRKPMVFSGFNLRAFDGVDIGPNSPWRADI
jgi:hypothetical protein